MELAEFITKILVIVFITIAIVGVIVQSGTFTGKISASTTDIYAVNFLESVASAPCLVETVNGEIRKGVFEKDKMDTFGDLCLKTAEDYKIEVARIAEDSNGEKTTNVIWTKQSRDFESKAEKMMFIAIKYSDTSIVPGVLKIYV